MTTSKVPTPKEAYVWVWLPGATEPVVAGKLTASDGTLVFHYGRSYLERGDAIPLYDQELPLQAGMLALPAGLGMPGCIRDAAPDAWGRRAILNRLLGRGGRDADVLELDELTYLLESGSDRVGGLDFQSSAKEYAPRHQAGASLDDLLRAAEKVEAGIPLDPALAQALQHGTSIGGARPKALLDAASVKYVAKFSSSSDVYNVVKAEFIAMRLAALCGLDVAQVELGAALGKDVLLVERFDRAAADRGWHRRLVLSALTLLGLDEMMARYASYEDLAEIVRHRFTGAPGTLKELFARLVFNILCGNTDDHARNHAAFWDGQALTLTPAYDICPQGRTGHEATQAMLIAGNNRLSQLSACLEAAHQFLLSREEARAIAAQQVQTIGRHWGPICAEARLSEADRRLLWGRQFLNPFAFQNLEGEGARLRSLADEIRGRNQLPM